MSNTFGNLDNTIEINLSGSRLLTSGLDRPFSLASQKRLKISGGGSGFVQIFADINNNGIVEGGTDVLLEEQNLNALTANAIARNFNPGNYIFRAAAFDIQSEGPYQINLQIDPSDRLFNYDYYRSVNPDLAGLGNDQAFEHFVEFGLREGRQFSPYIDLEVYASANSDLRSAGLVFPKELYEHLVNFGIAEGRIFSNEFNAGFYRQTYPDLAAAGLNNEQLLEHFSTFGAAEGRLGAAPAPPPPPRIQPNPTPPTVQVPIISSIQPVNVPSPQPNEPEVIEFVTTETEAPVETEPPQTQPVQTPGIDPVTGMSFEERVVELTNQFRRENGLPPLTPNTQLGNAAEIHSENMALQDFFSHTGLDGSEPSERAQRLGYPSQFVGENIGGRYLTPEKVVEGWKNSPGHRANMLNSRYTEIGVGYYFLENDTGSENWNHYWTQVFGTLPEAL